MKNQTPKTLIRIDLNHDGSLSLLSDLDRLDTQKMTVEMFTATMMSYVPAFLDRLKRMPPRSLALQGIAMQVFFAAACAVADNGSGSANTFVRLVKEFSKGRVSPSVKTRTLKEGEHL